jgi:hypothetical protein
MNFRLNVGGQLNEEEQNILDELKNSTIDFTDNANAPVASLSFASQGEAIAITYRVQLGDEVIQSGTLRVEKNERKSAGKLLAYRLFGIQKARIGEQPPVVPEPKKEVKENKQK